MEVIFTLVATTLPCLVSGMFGARQPGTRAVLLALPFVLLICAAALPYIGYPSIAWFVFALMLSPLCIGILISRSRRYVIERRRPRIELSQR